MTEFTVVDVGLLMLRLVLVFTFCAHATQKLLGWFSGAGLEASAAAFERLGQHPGKPMAMLAAASELTCGVLLALGVLVPLGVTVGLGTMLVAGASLTRSSGAFWNVAGGGEYPLFIGAVLACLAFLGGGELSVDGAMDLPWHEPEPTAAFVIAFGTIACALIAAVPPLVRGRPD
jgi:putative oxidoreductase